MGLLDELKAEIGQRKKEVLVERLSSTISKSKQQLEKLAEMQQHVEQQHRAVEEVAATVGALRKDAEGLGIPEEKFAAAELELLRERGSTPEQQKIAAAALVTLQAGVQELFDTLDTLAYQGHDVRGELDRAGLKQVWTPALRILDWERKAKLFLDDPTKWSQKERNEIFLGLAAQWRYNYDEHDCEPQQELREQVINLSRTFDLSRSYEFHPGKPCAPRGRQLELIARSSALLALADTRQSGEYKRPQASKQVYGEAVQAKPVVKRQDTSVSALLAELDASKPVVRVGKVMAWCEEVGKRALSEQDTREIAQRLGDRVSSLKDTWLWQAIINLPERLYDMSMDELRGKTVALFALEIPESVPDALRFLGVKEVRTCGVDVKADTIDSVVAGADYVFVWIARCGHDVTDRVGKRAKNARTVVGAVSVLSILKNVRGG